MLNILQNPNFEGGSSVGWDLESGWSVFSGGLPTPGVGYQGLFSGDGSAAIRNLTQIPISLATGGVITASCWAIGAPSSTAYASIRITFFRADGTEVPPYVNGAPVINNSVWITRTVTSGAPNDPSVAYAQVEFAVYNETGPGGGGHWACTNFYASYVSEKILSPAIGYYINLFTSEYRMSTNLITWQSVLMQPIRDLMTCMEQFNAAYDIDVAVGSQEDVLGEILGVARTVPFQPSGGVSPVLDDVTYRELLYATEAKDLWDGHITSMYNTWQQLFPQAVLQIIDNQNMTANISTSGSLTSIELDLINNGMIVPRPEGVQYNGSNTPAGTILFGFDYNNLVIAGFDTGVFA